MVRVRPKSLERYGEFMIKIKGGKNLVQAEEFKFL